MRNSSLSTDNLVYQEDQLVLSSSGTSAESSFHNNFVKLQKILCVRQIHQKIKCSLDYMMPIFLLKLADAQDIARRKLRE